MAREGVTTKEDFAIKVVKAPAPAAAGRTIKILPLHGEPIAIALPPGTVIIVDGKTI